MRQAQRWLRDLTNADLEEYLNRHEALAQARRSTESRMPMVLIGSLLSRAILSDPRARPYAEPYFWAPFTCHGAAEVIA